MRYRNRDNITWIMIAILILGILAVATDLKACEKPRFVTLNKSHHFSGGPHNETHNGVGVECAVMQDKWQARHAIYAGATYYINSHDDDAVLFSITSEKQIAKYFHIGVAGGFALGYDQYDAMPFGGVTTRVGPVRLLVTPPVAAIGLVVEF